MKPLIPPAAGEYSWHVGAARFVVDARRSWRRCIACLTSSPFSGRRRRAEGAGRAGSDQRAVGGDTLARAGLGSGTGISQFITEPAVCASAGRIVTTVEAAAAPSISTAARRADAAPSGGRRRRCRRRADRRSSLIVPPYALICYIIVKIGDGDHVARCRYGTATRRRSSEAMDRLRDRRIGTRAAWRRSARRRWRCSRRARSRRWWRGWRRHRACWLALRPAAAPPRRRRTAPAAPEPGAGRRRRLDRRADAARRAPARHPRQCRRRARCSASISSARTSASRSAIRPPPRLLAGTGDGCRRSRSMLGGLGGSGQHWEMAIHPVGGGGLLVRLADRSEARAAERMRVDFVANASHELRTPLATLLGFIETLQDADGRRTRRRAPRFLETCAARRKRMQRLVEDLMSLSRIEAERHSAPQRRGRRCGTLVAEVRDAIAGAQAIERERDRSSTSATTCRPVTGDRGAALAAAPQSDRQRAEIWPRRHAGARSRSARERRHGRG